MKSFLKVLAITTIILNCGIRGNQQELWKALQEGSYWKVKKAVEHGASVTEPLKDGTTPLLQAIETQNSKIVLYLLDHGAESTLNTPDECGLYPIIKAVFFLDESIIRTMLQRGAIKSINTIIHGETALSFAIRGQNNNIVRLLLEFGAAQSVNVPNEKHETLLLLAVQANDIKLVKLLFEYGAEQSINIASDKHQTPLSAACESDEYRMRNRFDKGDHPNIAMARLLLQHGAAFDTSNGDEDPIVVAVDSGNMKLVQLLWEFGAAEHIAKNVHNSDILTKAIKKGNMTMLRFLCEHGAMQIMNEIDRCGNTPLATAIDRSDIPMMQYVLEHGAAGSLQRASQYIAEKLDGTRTIKYLSAINFVQAYTRIKFIKEEKAQEIIALLTEWEAKTKQAETVADKAATE